MVDARKRLTRICWSIVLVTGALLMPAITRHTVLAATSFSFAGYIKACPASTTNCFPSLSGLDIDQSANVIYVISSGHLIRIDGSTGTFVDSFTLTNCEDARRPAVAHVSGLTKIYVGCESSSNGPYMKVLQVAGGGLGTVSELTSFKLLVPGKSTAYEMKTERASDANGMVYVVGDNGPGNPCNDPAFAIDTASDTIVDTNSSLGTLGNSDCGKTGIDDVAIGQNQLFWFNEDDQRIYVTTPSLTSVFRSLRVADQCANGSEDAPKFGDVDTLTNSQVVLATAPESLQPCGKSPETGAVYSMNPPSGSVSSRAVIQYAAGRVAAFGGGFIIANEAAYYSPSDASSRPICFNRAGTSCVDIRGDNGQLIQTIQLATAQTDVAYNPATQRAYLTLDNGVNGVNIAVLQRTS